jgi:hypothetical protein
MVADRQRDLIQDTLYRRRISPRDSCFVVNQAGLQLLKETSDILPAIESTILETIVPRYQDHANADHEFPGLTELFGAYLLIGSTCSPDRVVEFLQTLPFSLQAEAIVNIAVYFRKQKGEYIFRTAPSPQLVSYVRRAKAAENQGMQDAAESTLKWLDV